MTSLRAYIGGAVAFGLTVIWVGASAALAAGVYAAEKWGGIRE